MRITAFLLAVSLLPGVLLADSLQTAPRKAAYPLDPLTASEFGVIKKVLNKEFGKDIINVWAQLHEPPKEEVLVFRPGQPFRREAFVAFLSPEKKTAYEALIDLRAGTLLSSKDLGNLQPFITEYDHQTAVDVIDHSPEVRAALEKRGYKLAGKKVSDIFLIDYYAPGHDPRLRQEGKTIRAIRVLFADKQGGLNDYGPYVEGLMGLVDIYGKKLLALDDNPGPAVPKNVPQDIYSRRVLGPLRAQSPLTVVTPARGDLHIDGNHVRWGSWDFRYGFNQREGLVLYQIGYLDGGKVRPICYRAAISEMLVPYAEASPAWAWREFFDAGEYGLGASSNPVYPGKELPANAVTADAVLPEMDLTPSKDFPSRVCFYERDGGALFAHTQNSDGSRLYARGKELVVGFVATLGNYDYLYKWVFRQDGSFGFETELEGLILDKTVAPGAGCPLCDAQTEKGPGTYTTDDEPYGMLVSPQILGVFHQHWINLRLDFDIDGTVNAVKEVETEAVPPDPVANPRGRAFRLRQTVFGTAEEAERSIDPAANRFWVVYNPAVKSPLGHPTGYALVPQGNTAACLPADRWGQQTSFVQRHVWVTPYRPDEFYAAGRYPNQAPDEARDNLYNYAKQGGNIYKADDVLWYSLGFTHITRPEDYPVMPAVKVGVDFEPEAFFLKSPAMPYARTEPGAAAN